MNLLGSRRRRLFRQSTDLLEVTVLLNLLSFQRFLFLGQNVLLTHADLEAFLEATALAKATVREIHLAPLIIGTLEISLTGKHTCSSLSAKLLNPLVSDVDSSFT